MPFRGPRLAVRPRWRATLNFNGIRPTKLVVGQVSLPMRIALMATLAFAAIWFVALRPKPPAAEPAAAAPAAAQPQSAPGKAAAQAQQAAGASQESAAKHETAAGSEQQASVPAAPAQRAQQSGEPARGRVDVTKAAGPKVSKAAMAVLEDVARGKVAVLLFWDPRLTDDRFVHRTVMGLDRRGGKVRVHKSPISKLADFEPITSGVPVVTSPTVLVIDRAGRARTVSGLTVPGELEELVGKALRVKP
jgi:hypothetical protein